MKIFRKAIFLIHGFSGDYSDNENLLNELQYMDNYDVYTITLPGHDKSKLKNIEYTDWVHASEMMLQKLLIKYKTVYLIGHSMGGVISTHLASKYKISKLVLVAPAFDYFNKTQIKSDLLNFKKVINEEENLNAYQQIFHKLFSVDKSALDEFKKLVQKYSDDIEKVTCPVFFLHGTIDEVVPKSASEEAFSKLKNVGKTLCLVEGVRHYPFKSIKKNEAIYEISKFLKTKNISKKEIKLEI